MKQLQALKELAAKVEVAPLGKFDPLFELAFGNENLLSYAASDAYFGSLDAAHSLHKAVLGDRWSVSLYEEDSGKYLWLLACKKDETKYVECWAITSARAWLLAIIKAKISEL